MANTKFSQAIADRIIAAINDGATQRAAARMVGVTPESLSIWKRKFPAFGEAIERAHAEAQVFVEQSVRRAAIRGNVKAQIFWLQTRHPAEWLEVRQHKISVAQTFEDWVAASGKPSTSAEQAEASHD